MRGDNQPEPHTGDFPTLAALRVDSQSCRVLAITVPLTLVFYAVVMENLTWIRRNVSKMCI